MQRDVTARTDETAPDEADHPAPNERQYFSHLAKPVTRPREWTIRRVEGVIGSIA